MATLAEMRDYWDYWKREPDLGHRERCLHEAVSTPESTFAFRALWHIAWDGRTPYQLTEEDWERHCAELDGRPPEGVLRMVQMVVARYPDSTCLDGFVLKLIERYGDAELMEFAAEGEAGRDGQATPNRIPTSNDIRIVALEEQLERASFKIELLSRAIQSLAEPEKVPGFALFQLRHDLLDYQARRLGWTLEKFNRMAAEETNFHEYDFDQAILEDVTGKDGDTEFVHDLVRSLGPNEYVDLQNRFQARRWS